MIVHQYKEWLLSAPKEAYWVWDTYDEFPTWSEKKQDYVFKKEPKRISAKEAKELIKKHNLVMVYSDDDGTIYTKEDESKN